MDDSDLHTYSAAFQAALAAARQVSRQPSNPAYIFFKTMRLTRADGTPSGQEENPDVA